MSAKEFPPYEPSLHPAQLQIIGERRRFNVVNCGRRWGKTVLGIDLDADASLEGFPVGWFAPGYRYLSEAWRDMIKLLAPYTVRSNATEHRIELVTGGVVEMWSLDGGNAGRSRRYRRVVVDEAAMVPGLLGVWNDAIRPTLTDLRGDAWFLSTPRGRNDFWQLYQYGLDPLREDWQCWQMPTTTNPFIPKDEVEAARRELPEQSYQQEYLAMFLEDGAYFRKVREAATAKGQEYAQHGHSSHPKHTYIVGVDWGEYEDYSVFAVIDVTTSELVHMDRSNRIDYVTQTRRLEELCKRFETKTVIAEGNGQSTTVELLRRYGLAVTEFITNNTNKHEIIDALRWAFDQGKLKIIDDPVLLAELQAFEATRTPNDRLKLGAPTGQHDDCVMALALAWSMADNYVPVRVEKRVR